MGQKCACVYACVCMSVHTCRRDICKCAQQVVLTYWTTNNRVLVPNHLFTALISPSLHISSQCVPSVCTPGQLSTFDRLWSLYFKAPASLTVSFFSTHAPPTKSSVWLVSLSLSFPSFSLVEHTHKLWHKHIFPLGIHCSWLWAQRHANQIR